MKYSRSSFLKTLGLGALASSAGALQGASTFSPSESQNQLKLGLASYTLRKFSLEKTLATAKQLQLNHIALKSMHMPLESDTAVLKKTQLQCQEAGVELYGAGVVYMKSEGEVENAFRYAVAAGLEVIIGVPNHELLGLVEKKVKETDIKVAIHNHGPGDKVYPSPESIYEKVKDLDARIGMCIDIGHTIRIGFDPAEEIKKYADRLYDLHLKDVTVAQPRGSSVELGRGVIDLRGVMKALKSIHYTGILGLEYEKDGDNPFLGLAESVGYVRALMDVV